MENMGEVQSGCKGWLLLNTGGNSDVRAFVRV